MGSATAPTSTTSMFDNQFSIEDLLVFDKEALHHLISEQQFGITLEMFAASLHGTSPALRNHVQDALAPEQRELFACYLKAPCSNEHIRTARKNVLDGLFWELTYWKTPELYEALTEGEKLHPGIFQRLSRDLRAKTVLDAGAGSGRASFAALKAGATLVYAVEPSPGLLRILRRKIQQQGVEGRIVPRTGRFDALPLPDQSVDVTLSCSAFTALPGQGGETGLAELRRVTRSGGKIVLIWPRSEDREWLCAQGFQYVTLPVQEDFAVHFQSLHSALQCARCFYAHNYAVLHYLLTKRRPTLPFSVIGIHPPCEYCWLPVKHAHGC